VTIAVERFRAEPEQRVARKAWWRRADPLWLAAPGVLFLVIFLVVPTARLMSLSFVDAKTGALSLVHYLRAFQVDLYVRVLGMTFSVAAQNTLLCLLLGYPIAYWLARMPARRMRLMILLVMLPFWTSALVKNFTWLVLMARKGIVVEMLLALGVAPPIQLLYSRATVLAGMTHTMLPLAVLTMLPVMVQLDARLPHAAMTLGASGPQALWRIFFQLSMPGVAAAGLVVFIGSLGFFITPALLGGPREMMLGQLIIEQIQSLLDWGFAGALAMLLVLSSVLICVVYDRLFGLSSFAGGGTVRDAADRKWLRRIGMRIIAIVGDVTSMLSEALTRWFGPDRLKWLLPAYCGVMVFFLMVPSVAVLPMGFTSGSFLSFPPPGFGMRWMHEYFGSPVWTGATLRSFTIAFGAGLLTTAIACLAAFGVARGSKRLAGMTFLLFLTPMIVPNVVIAVALFYLFAQVSLVATNTGLVIGHTVTGLPIVFVTILATLKAFDWRLNQAAATLGANPARALFHVTLPMIRGGLLAAFLFAFIHSFEELTVAIFVGGGAMTTLPKQMWDDALLQVTPTLAAASVVVIVIVTALCLLAEYLRPRV
jgi:putative spermidine/putrescine transport system permease protein